MDVDIGQAWRYVHTQPNDSLDMLGGWSGAELGVAWVMCVVCVVCVVWVVWVPGITLRARGGVDDIIDHRPLQFETSISRKAVR